MNEEIIETKVIEVKAKNIPFRCVVCNGWGTVSNQRVRCGACQGKGYLLIPAESEEGIKP